MPDEFITRREHEEFARRMDTENHRRDDEDKRQNKRLDAVEASVQRINDLTIAIEKMAVNIGTMAAELKQQGERLESIEAKPGKHWEAIVDKVIMLIVGGVVGYALLKLGIGG